MRVANAPMCVLIAAGLAFACGGREANPVGSLGVAGPAGAAGPSESTVGANGASPGSGGTSTVVGADGGEASPIDAGTPNVAPPVDAVTLNEAFVAPVATQLVDSMRNVAPDGQGISGGWGTYSDRALSWSEPPILTTDAGLLAPLESTPVVPVGDGRGPLYDGAAQPYRRFFGYGESQWGAGLGLNFAGAPPDGGPVPMNACDGGAIFDVVAADNDSLVQLPFDASGWTGLQFWAKSLTGSPRTLHIIVQDDRSNPFGASAALGGCNACAGEGVGGCGDGPRGLVVFPAEWSHVQVPFSALHPNGWSGADVTRTVDTNTVYSVNFEVEDVPLPPFDLAIAYVELYK